MRRRLCQTALAVILLGGAAAIFVGGTLRRIDRIDRVTGLADTGSAALSRRLIIPERCERSYHWLAQTEQMLVSDEQHVTHVDYDNAPVGRAVSETSAYRWWLGTLAWLDHRVFGAAPAAYVESVARWADPAALALVLMLSAVLTAVEFGAWSAAVLVLAGTLLFPFATEFFPGVPDNHGLVLGCVLLGTLALTAALGRSTATARVRGLSIFGGVFDALALWICPSLALPLLGGLALGAALALVMIRSDRQTWRAWSISGASTILLTWLFDHAGTGLWNSFGPLFGIAWIGAAEWLGWLSDRSATSIHLMVPGRPAGGRSDAPLSEPGRVENSVGSIAAAGAPRQIVVLVLATFALVAVPFALWKSGLSLTSSEPDAFRLARVPGAPSALTVGAWLKSADAHSLGDWAAMLPVLVLFAAIWFALRRSTAPVVRVQLAAGVGGLLAALCIAWSGLRAWAAVDACVVVLFVVLAQAGTAALSLGIRLLVLAFAVAVSALGAAATWPARFDSANSLLTSSEAQEVIERHLGRWLAAHTAEPAAVVYAPPHASLTLSYYGRLRVVGTHAADNTAGIRATVLIAGAKSLDAVQALVEARQVRYLVVPSWDPFFEEFAERYLAGSAAQGSLLVQELRRLNLPPWLRPIAYQMPPIGALEKQWVLVFEVVGEQSAVVATSRLADFLVELGDLDRAKAVGGALRQFPGNVGALAALSQVQTAAGDNAAAGQTLASLASLVSAGGDRNLPWDRRVGVAIALGRADQVALARTQTQRCLAEADEKKLRALSTAALYNLLVLTRVLELQWPNHDLEPLALSLLPDDVRRSL